MCMYMYMYIYIYMLIKNLYVIVNNLKLSYYDNYYIFIILVNRSTKK